MNINTHTSHPSAFISSTFIDLKEERIAVAEVLGSSGLNINALDVKPASTGSSKSEIIAGIRESDFIIVIIGERYGSIIPAMTGSNKLSITRWEYLRAVNNYKKDALVYFKKVTSNDPKYYDEETSDFKAKRNYLREFKRNLSAKHNPKYFSTANELAEEIKNALIPTYRAGVNSLLSRIISYKKEIEILNSENQRLNSLLKQKEKSGSPELTDGSFGIHSRQNALTTGISNVSATISPSTGIGHSKARNALTESYGIIPSAQEGNALYGIGDARPRSDLGLRPRGILSEAINKSYGLSGYNLLSDDKTEKR